MLCGDVDLTPIWKVCLEDPLTRVHVPPGLDIHTIWLLFPVGAALIHTVVRRFLDHEEGIEQDDVGVVSHGWA